MSSIFKVPFFAGGCWPAAGACSLASGFAPPVMLAVIHTAATLQLRFGVDQVAAGYRHLVARLEARQDLDLVIGLLSDLDITRLEHPR